ncbi:MAG TPA: hypothetical protein VL119_08665 [Acidimicrobiia bacterium]|nr:hypothetical protein [Acidimicrobiia bacterium]
MARVGVLIDDLELGDLPALSVKTGRACANPVAIVLRPGQRMLSPTGPKIACILPLEASRARLRRLLTRASWVALVAGAAALAAALTGVGSIVFLVAALAFASYAALVVVGDVLWVGARASEQAGEITLTRVHAAFARAVDAQYGR